MHFAIDLPLSGSSDFFDTLPTHKQLVMMALFHFHEADSALKSTGFLRVFSSRFRPQEKFYDSYNHDPCTIKILSFVLLIELRAKVKAVGSFIEVQHVNTSDSVWQLHEK